MDKTKLKIQNSLNRPAWTSEKRTGGLDAHKYISTRYGLKRIRKLYALRSYERR